MKPPFQLTELQHIFQSGLPKIQLAAPFIPAVEELATQDCSHEHVLHFIPASGAAARLFAPLYQVDAVERAAFFRALPRFPFYDLLANNLTINLTDVIAQQDIQALLWLLGEHGLGFLALPKGCLPFHRLGDKTQTAFQAQMQEVLESNFRFSSIHFTLPGKQAGELAEQLRADAQQLGAQFNQMVYVTASEQSENTHLPVWDETNQHFVKDPSGEILVHPAGHGTLISNLNHCYAPYIYIKNIDNILAQPHRVNAIAAKKKILGQLITLRERVHSVLRLLASGQPWSNIQNAAEELLDLFIHPTDKDKIKWDKKWIFDFFNRPIRVCGLIKQPRKTGGRAFWVRNRSTGLLQFQLIESQQINWEDEQQKAIADSAPYLNPVHLACSPMDYRGQKFDLMEFVDWDQAFLSEKNKHASAIKICEYPGLWNGGMANWLSIGVEVPAESFAPVKTLYDLLHPYHQTL